MPALRQCRHCHTPFELQANEAYCSTDCESAHEQQCRANVEAGIEKRRATKRQYDLERRGVPIAAPRVVVANWLDLPLVQRADYLQAHGPQLGE